MKKIFSIAIASLAFLTLGSCSDSDYTDKYKDPGKTSTANVPDAFTAVLAKGNTWMNPVYYRYYCQMSTSGVFSGILGNSNSKGRFMGAGEGRYDDRWKNFYDMLTQYRLLEKTYNDLPEAQQTANKVFLMAGRTLIDAQLHEMLSLFGSIPFKGAGTLWQTGDYAAAKNQCVYDDDVTLYRQILADLKEAGDYFVNVDNNSMTSFARKDYTTASGNSQMWREYINSLRLRIAMHLATNGDLTNEAHAAIKEILDNPSQYPVIETNDDNMGVTANTSNDTFNWGKSLSQALHGGYAPSQAVLDAMNLPADGIPDANTDPRINAMLDANPDGQYITYDVTKINSVITNIADKKESAYKEKGWTGAGYYCTLDSLAIGGYAEYSGNANTFGLWVSAAEVKLLTSEAYLMGYGVAKDEAKAKQAFIDGVVLSTEYYWAQKNGSSLFKAGNDSYKGYRPLVQPTDAEVLAYAEKIWKPTQETVCTQLWLNYDWTNMLEAWNVVRRTGFPLVTFATDTQMSSYPTPPHRLPYPNDESTYNANNYKDAVAKYYKESTGYYTKLFWAKDGDYYKMVTATNN